MIRLVSTQHAPRAGRPLDCFSQLLPPDEAVRLLAQPGHAYLEYLSHEREPEKLTKVFMDFETYMPGPESCSPDQLVTYERQVRQQVDAFMDCIRPVAPHAYYKVASRHGVDPKNGKFKVSFRPFVSGVAIRYPDIRTILLKLSDHHPKGSNFWDLGIYTPKERLLAAINGAKNPPTDTRVLTMEAPDDNPLDYIAQYVDTTWPVCQDLSGQASGSTAGTPRPRAQQHTDPLRDRAEDLLLAETLSRDQLLLNFLRVQARLKFRHTNYTDHCPHRLGPKLDLYLDTRVNRHTCPIAQKVHVSNNAILTVAPLSARTGAMVTYFCLDADCRPPAGNADLDISAHVDSATLALIRNMAAERGPDSPDPCLSMLKGIARLLRLPEVTAVDSMSKSAKNIFTFDVKVKDGYQGTMSVDPQTLLATASLSNQDNGHAINQEIFLNHSPETNLVLLTSPIDLARLVPGEFEHGQEWTIFRPCVSKAVFKSQADDGKEAQIIVDPNSSDSGVVQVMGKTKHLLKRDHKLLQEAYTGSIKNAIETQPNLKWIVNHINIGAINVIQCPPDNGEEAFVALRDKLLTSAQQQRLRKCDGYIYRPLSDFPCAYEQWRTYEDFINYTLIGDAVYYKNPRRFKELLEFVTHINYHPMLPTLATDLDLVSFSNGVLLLSTRQLLPHTDPRLTDRVARHHINQEYSGSLDTPLFDEILDAQFDRDVADILCALLGRTLFPVRALDDWQVMPYLVGIGGTGKSLILTVLQHLFAKNAVGTLASKGEEVFGLDNICDKQVVLGRDMPEKLSGAISQENLQSMTTGEDMQIARKGRKAVSITWKAPVVMCSNHDPDYKNTGGNISRRLVTFRFERVIARPNGTLLSRILATELPSIMARCLSCYEDLQARVMEAGDSFWAAMPAKIIEWQHRLSAATNKLHEFLDMDEDERGWRIERVPGKVTWITEFKKAFEGIMNSKLDIYKNLHVIHQFGFTMSAGPKDLINVCKSCKQIARNRGDKCCDSASHGNRTQKTVIYDMELQPRTVVPDF